MWRTADEATRSGGYVQDGDVAGLGFLDELRVEVWCNDDGGDLVAGDPAQDVGPLIRDLAKLPRHGASGVHHGISDEQPARGACRTVSLAG